MPPTDLIGIIWDIWETELGTLVLPPGPIWSTPPFCMADPLLGPIPPPESNPLRSSSGRSLFKASSISASPPILAFLWGGPSDISPAVAIYLTILTVFFNAFLF